MPRKFYSCGIYKISTPSDSSCYVGSSIRIERRWSEHKHGLRNNKHHSIRLQNAWNKYGELKFEIIELCDENELNDKEQFWIDSLKAELNSSKFVKNIWLDSEVREKFKKIHESDKWKEERRIIANTENKAWRKIECSDGQIFKNMAEAARYFGVRTSGIKALALTQSIGGLGVRFKFKNEEWKELKTISQKIIEARKRNGTDKLSEISKKRMSDAKKGIAPKVDLKKIAENNCVPVISIDKKTGVKIFYKSVRDAGNKIKGDRKLSSVSAQISKCTHGNKKSAYGFFWIKGSKNAQG